MNSELFEALELLEKEKGIAVDYMLERVEAALISAYKRDRNGLANVRVEINKDKKSIRMFEQKNIVEEVMDPEQEITLDEAHNVSKRYKLGDVCETELKPKNFRRLSAQTAKQVIIQGIREAERSMMIKEYESKKEEIVSAVVIRVDPTSGNATLEIGKNEMVLFRHEQIPTENLQVGDRIKVFVTEIKKETRGPSVVLSRVHPGLVRRLFELEVPELKDGTIEIVSVAREAGSRTKIAVRSNDEKVDPIGACIGPKGARKNLVTDELCGEKIDIIPYSEVTEEFISAALAPAAVDEVIKLPESDRAYRAIVSDEQLSLAIGKEGQNARLAAKLTGFKIDIKSYKTLAMQE